MGCKLMVPIRVTQGIHALVVIVLSSFVAHWYNTTTVLSSPSEINFLIFSGIWSVFSLACIEAIPRFFPRASNPYVAFGVEVTNVLFWFAGFVALSVFLSKLLFCRGSVCHAARADVAFASFAFALWTASAVLLGRDLFKAGVRSRPSGAGAGAAVAVVGIKEVAA
ncbi:hypothetical protein VTK56DRAFT_9644 [Thermocarpiscus australiensis]